MMALANGLTVGDMATRIVLAATMMPHVVDRHGWEGKKQGITWSIPVLVGRNSLCMALAEGPIDEDVATRMVVGCNHDADVVPML